MTVKLDPRPARKLTSRECSKVLGGLLGGLASVLGSEATKELLRALDNDLYWDMVGSLECMDTVAPTSLQESERVALRSIGGLVAGLCETSSRKTVQKAVRWWLESSDAWRFIDYLVKNSGKQNTPPFDTKE